MKKVKALCLTIGLVLAPLSGLCAVEVPKLAVKAVIEKVLNNSGFKGSKIDVGTIESPLAGRFCNHRFEFEATPPWSDTEILTGMICVSVLDTMEGKVLVKREYRLVTDNSEEGLGCGQIVFSLKDSLGNWKRNIRATPFVGFSETGCVDRSDAYACGCGRGGPI